MRHVLIAKNKMRNRELTHARTRDFLPLVFVVGNHFHMHSNNSFIDEKLFDMHKHAGSRRNSEGSERRGWKVVYDSPIRAFNDFPRLTHSFVAAVLSELFEFYPMRVFFYLFILSCTYNKIYFV